MTSAISQPLSLKHPSVGHVQLTPIHHAATLARSHLLTGTTTLHNCRQLMDDVPQLKTVVSFQGSLNHFDQHHALQRAGMCP
jgi:hypothetical protein